MLRLNIRSIGGVSRSVVEALLGVHLRPANIGIPLRKNAAFPDT